MKEIQDRDDFQYTMGGQHETATLWGRTSPPNGSTISYSTLPRLTTLGVAPAFRDSEFGAGGHQVDNAKKESGFTLLSLEDTINCGGGVATQPQNDLSSLKYYTYLSAEKMTRKGGELQVRPQLQDIPGEGGRPSKRCSMHEMTIVPGICFATK